MKFKTYLLESSNDELAKYQAKGWDEYLSRVPILRLGVEILSTLEKYGRAYIVGGCVRDIILGKTPDDIDIATNAPIDTIEKLFPSHDIGKNKEFGIVVITYKGHNFEIAQFRTDSYVKPKTVRRIIEK
jgi:tRNA nucleotidyltransferase/poly(A) polymerase